MNMASSKDDNEDNPCTALPLPPDTFLMDIFMQDARSKARAGMRGLPANPSPALLREFVEAHDDREHASTVAQSSPADFCARRKRACNAHGLLPPNVQRYSGALACLNEGWRLSGLNIYHGIDARGGRTS